MRGPPALLPVNRGELTSSRAPAIAAYPARGRVSRRSVSFWSLPRRFSHTYITERETDRAGGSRLRPGGLLPVRVVAVWLVPPRVDERCPVRVLKAGSTGSAPVLVTAGGRGAATMTGCCCTGAIIAPMPTRSATISSRSTPPILARTGVPGATLPSCDRPAKATGRPIPSTSAYNGSCPPMPVQALRPSPASMATHTLMYPICGIRIILSPMRQRNSIFVPMAIRVAILDP